MNFSGLAQLSDFQTSDHRRIFELMEREQDAFLSKEPEFRSPEYGWPRDPLHTWSRAWEYPYAFFHISKRLKGNLHGARIADVGSGVTFFPFTIAKLGGEVICTDTDEVAAKDVPRAAKAINHAPGSVTFRATDGKQLPFQDEELDIIYCISVLEHVKDVGAVARDIARTLKPGGLLLLTIDLDMRGDQELGIAQREQLGQILNDAFEYGAPYRPLVHPGNLLQSLNGPYPARPVGANLAIRFVRTQVLKPLFRRRMGHVLPFHLAVEGFVLTKRS